MRSMGFIAASCVLAFSVRGAEPMEAPAGEAGFKPGLSWMLSQARTEIEAAVEKRRDKTALSRLAASMEPGTWAELKTTMPKRLWSAPSRKGLHIGTWSDDAHWDSRTGQFLFFGVRQARKFVAYSEVSNAWRVIEFKGVTNAPAVPQQFGHQYSGNAHDLLRSRFYTKGRRYDVLTGMWTVIPSHKKQSREKNQVITWSSAMDGLFVLLFQDPGLLRYLEADANKWADLGKIPVHGYHSMARDNPFRTEVLFAGGNNSQRVAVVGADGKARRMKDFPYSKGFTIRSGILTVDPLSGRYLFKIGQNFVEFDSAANEYRLIADFTKSKWPFSRYEAPLVAFIPEYGVTMWADKKVYLYKHDASADYPVVDPKPEAETKKQ